VVGAVKTEGARASENLGLTFEELVSLTGCPLWVDALSTSFRPLPFVAAALPVRLSRAFAYSFSFKD
jgi:hypothetical protein